MEKKKLYYIIILAYSLIIFSDCKKKEEEPVPDPCRFSMSHVMRTKCIIISPGYGAILQSTSATLKGGFGGSSPSYNFYLGTNPDSLKLVSSQPGNTLVIDNLKVNTTYYWNFSAFEQISCGLGCGSSTSSFFIVPDKDLPYVATVPVPEHINTSASIGGNVLFEGSSAVTDRGVYWGRSAGTETTGTKVYIGSGPGAFSIFLAVLDPATEYYFRTYASNANGTYYGLENKFKTGQNPVFQTISDINGNVYKTLEIGSQIWMVENLKTSRYNDGTKISFITDDLAWSNLTPKYTWFNNDSATYKNLYGALYNGFAVSTGKLCPTGWHIPSDSEWKTLEMYLGMTQKAADALNVRGTDQGLQMKSTTSWPDDGNGFNTSNFSALPGGIRTPVGTFSKADNTQWWSTTKDPQVDFLWSRLLMAGSPGVIREVYSMQSGFSVRCVRN